MYSWGRRLSNKWPAPRLQENLVNIIFERIQCKILLFNKLDNRALSHLLSESFRSLSVIIQSVWKNMKHHIEIVYISRDLFFLASDGARLGCVREHFPLLIGDLSFLSFPEQIFLFSLKRDFVEIASQLISSSASAV